MVVGFCYLLPMIFPCVRIFMHCAVNQYLLVDRKSLKNAALVSDSLQYCGALSIAAPLFGCFLLLFSSRTCMENMTRVFRSLGQRESTRITGSGGFPRQVLACPVT